MMNYHILIVPGRGRVRRGDETLFRCMRLEVQHRIEEIFSRQHPKFGCGLPAQCFNRVVSPYEKKR